MATDTAEQSVHNTLTGTTVDTVTLPTKGGIEVFAVANESGSADLHVTVGNGVAANVADPVAGANGTFRIAAGATKNFRLPPGPPARRNIIVKVLGSGNTYGIERGVASTDGAGSTSGGSSGGLPDISKAEDDAHVSGDLGIQMLGVRNDAGTSLAGASGDYLPLTMDSSGRLYVNVAGGVAAGVAEDSALSGNALRIGGRAHSGVPSAMSADNDLVTPWLGRSGETVVIPQPRQVNVTVTPAISTTIYASGDVMGASNAIAAALAAGRPGRVVGASLRDLANQRASIELWLFLVAPTLVGADNAAFDISDANLTTARPVGVIDFSTSNYRQTASNALGTGTSGGGAGVDIPFVTAATANLFGVFVSRGTPTYGTTSDLVAELIIQQF